METGELIAFASLALTLIIAIVKFGARAGKIEQKLDTVCSKLDKMSENNREDHKSIYGRLDRHGERLARIEAKLEK